MTIAGRRYEFSVGMKKKTKNFVWGMCGDIPTHYFLHGVLPTQIFLHGDLCGEDVHGSVIQGCQYSYNFHQSNKNISIIQQNEILLQSIT